MVEETYSAGLISQSFWFVEMKKVIKLIDEGKSEEEIKKMCIDENLFGAAKEYRAKRIYGYIWNRAKRLDKTLIDLFCTSDLATQKVINLIAILRSDRLFFEFMFEVYREKNILGIPVIEDADINIFFKNKEIQSEDIAAWTDGTKRRLRSIYFNYLTDAILEKNEAGKQTLTLLYDDKATVIKNLILFNDGVEKKLYSDRENFADIYPFIPYQFNLLGSVLTSIRTHGASGKHLAEGERSMLALFKESAVKVMNDEPGTIVPFNMFYDALEQFLDHSHKGVISRALDNDYLNPKG